MNDLFSRMLRAAKLDVHLYEEVERDTRATGQAVAVVILVSLISGIASITIGGVSGLISGLVITLVFWAVFAYLTYLIGAKLLAEPQTEANWGQLARTLGFAYSIGVLHIIRLIPNELLAGLVALVVGVWTIVAWVIAIRQALDYKSTLRAVGVAILGAIGAAIVAGIIGLLFFPQMATTS